MDIKDASIVNFIPSIGIGRENDVGFALVYLLSRVVAKDGEGVQDSIVVFLVSFRKQG